MRKSAFSICENKGADQLHVIFATSIVQTIYFLKPLSIFCGCSARFVSDHVGNPEDRFSRDESHFPPKQETTTKKLHRLH